MTSSKRILFAASLCALLFTGFWINTLHLHALTMGLNLNIQELLSPLQENKVLELLNHLGGNLVFMICSGIVLLDLGRRKKWRLMIYSAATIVTVVLMTYLLKEMTYSPRPEPFSTETDSFPSGHTMRASLWCGLILLLERLKIYKLKKVTQLFIFAIPLLIGFTRLALGRHWFDDVMGSYFLVSGALLVLYSIARKKPVN